MVHTDAGIRSLPRKQYSSARHHFRGRLLKALSGLIIDNRIYTDIRPYAGIVLGAASEPESRFGLAFQPCKSQLVVADKVEKSKKKSQNELNPTSDFYGDIGRDPGSRRQSGSRKKYKRISPISGTL